MQDQIAHDLRITFDQITDPTVRPRGPSQKEWAGIPRRVYCLGLLRAKMWKFVINPSGFLGA